MGDIVAEDTVVAGTAAGDTLLLGGILRRRVLLLGRRLVYCGCPDG